MFVVRFVELGGASLPSSVTGIIAIYVESGTTNYVLERELFICRDYL